MRTALIWFVRIAILAYFALVLWWLIKGAPVVEGPAPVAVPPRLDTLAEFVRWVWTADPDESEWSLWVRAILLALAAIAFGAIVGGS